MIQIVQTTVCNVVGRSSLEQVFGDADTRNKAIEDVLDVTTTAWGMLLEMVELNDIELPPSTRQAVVREAEAERKKRAKIIAANRGALSVGRLTEAAFVIVGHLIALPLRNLQVMAEIAIEKNSTIIFPVQPMDSVRAVQPSLQTEPTNGTRSPAPSRR